jgi:hypothetical protein
MLEEVAIVCIAKNEEKYIHEWIYYHIKLGVSKIIIYDNSDNHSLGNLNITWAGKVLVIHYPGSGKKENIQRQTEPNFEGTQVNAYDNYIVNWRQRNLLYKWVAFLDCDEFIKLTHNETIVQFLKRIDFHQGVLTMNWVHFGSNGHEKYINKPVLERFTKREKNIHAPFHKCICVITDILYWEYPGHKPITNKFYRNSHGQHIPQDLYTKNPAITDIYIAHIMCKSKEEFEIKMKRGNKHLSKGREGREFGNREWSHFNEFDKNEVEDTSLRDFLFSQKQTYNGLEVDNYLWNNRDLYRANILNPERLWEHYIHYGKKEGRKTNLN